MAPPLDDTSQGGPALPFSFLRVLVVCTKGGLCCVLLGKVGFRGEAGGGSRVTAP